MKNTSRSKEDADNLLIDKTERVMFDMKQSLSFQIVIFLRNSQKKR